MIAERRSVAEKFVRAYRKGAYDYHVAFNARDSNKPAGGQEIRGPGYDEAIAILA